MSSQNAPQGYKRYLDGVRALAVISVILFHCGWSVFSAGYLGVDVFFVLSGYVITLSTLREYERTGGVDALAFLARRVRRLVPAALLVVVVTAAATWLLMSDEVWFEVAATFPAALLCIENEFLIYQDADYWRQTFVTSPVQHYWSLAIEQQFYLGYITAVIIAVACIHCVRRIRRTNNKPGDIVAPSSTTPLRAILVLASLAALTASAVWYNHRYTEERALTSAVYMSTLCRVYQPLVGVAHGCIAMLKVDDDAVAYHISARCQTLFMVGLEVIYALCWLNLVLHVESTMDGALGPIVAFAMATLLWYLNDIDATTSRADATLASRLTGLLRAALETEVLVVIGKISYGMYLWHYPFIVLGDMLELAPLVAYGMAARCLTVLFYSVVMASLSYWLLETRISAISLGKPKDGRGRVYVILSAWLGLMIAALLAWPVLFAPVSPHQIKGAYAGGFDFASTSSIAALITAASATTPESPPHKSTYSGYETIPWVLDENVEQKQPTDDPEPEPRHVVPFIDPTDLADTEAVARSGCAVVYGSEDPRDVVFTVLLIGDSHAGAVRPVYASAAKANNFRLLSCIRAGCSILDESCAKWSITAQFARQYRADMLILHNFVLQNRCRDVSYARCIKPTMTLAQHKNHVQQSAPKVLKTFTNYNTSSGGPPPLFWVLPPPTQPDQKCDVVHSNNLAHCNFDVQYLPPRAAVVEVLRDLEGRETGLHVVDPTDTLCPDGRCVMPVGHAAQQSLFNNHHVTHEGWFSVAQAWGRELGRAGFVLPDAAFV